MAKTSSVWFGRELFTQSGKDVLSLGTLGNYLGEELRPSAHTTPDPDVLFPLLAEARAKGIKDVLMEVSSHSLAQNKLGPIRFKGALFTSFSRDHLDFHPTMKDYFLEKWKLFDQYLLPTGRRVISKKCCLI